MKYKKKIKLGIIGFNEGNGHPYSFSAIINGYKKSYFKKIGYKNILNYLENKKKKDFGIFNAKVTHAWSQNYKKTVALSKACKIKHPLKNLIEMTDCVDAVIIARDDWKSHYRMAIPFLEKELPVFVDKPLSFSSYELDIFQKYVNKGLLFSTSSLRFSNEILIVKDFLKTSGKIKFIISNVPNNIEKYSVHILEFISALGLLKPLHIKKIRTGFESYLIKLKNNIHLMLNCLGKESQVLNVTFISQKRNLFINFTDNFSSFKNTLERFIVMVRNKKVIVPYNKTLGIMNLIKDIKNL